MEKAEKAQKKPAASARGEEKTQNKLDEVVYQRNLFFSMVLDMTWQLAIVVIVPVVGGHFLDEALDTTPWLTVAGFAVALLGMVAVMKRVVAESTRRTGQYQSKNSKTGKK